MKKEKKMFKFPRWGIIAGIAVLVIALVFVTVMANNKTDNSKNKTWKKTDFTVEDLHFAITYGFDNNAKYGRDLQYTVRVENTGEDFAGTISARFLASFNNAVDYKEELQIASGEKKTIKFYIPAKMTDEKIMFLVNDKNERYLGGSEFSTRFTGYSSTVYVGIVSEEDSLLGYFTDKGSRVFYIDKENLPDDKKGLDTLDVLVVNQVAGESFSDGQVEAIKGFVNQGGSLLIGTGDQLGKSLDVFSKDMLTGKMGDLEEYVPGEELGLSTKNKKGKKTVSMEYLNLDLEDSTVILRDEAEGKNLIQSVKYGKGNVQVASIDLGLDKGEWDSLGNVIRSTVLEHLSIARKKLIDSEAEDEHFTWWRYNLVNLLSDVGDTKLPNVRVYLVLIFVYILLIGPVLYLICKKKDCRQWLLVLIPGMAVLFSLLIYFIGSGTRVKSRMLNYVTYLEYEGDGRVTENSCIGIITPNNKPYALSFDEGIDINQATDYLSYDNYGYGDIESLKNVSPFMELSQDAGNTRVQVNTRTAFETAHLELTQEREDKQDIAVELYYEDGKISGTVTNSFDCDIKDCYLIAEGNVYTLGDIKAKEIRDLAKDKPELEEGGSTNFDYLFSNGIDFYQASIPFKTRMQAAAMSAIAYNLDARVNGTVLSYIIGVLDTGKPQESIASLGYENMSGVTLFSKPVTIKASLRGKKMLINIDNLECTTVNGSALEEFGTRWMGSEQTEIRYMLDRTKKPLKLIYGKAFNEEIENTAQGEGFAEGGAVSIYNYTRGEWELMFESGTEGEFAFTKDVMDGENSFLLRYEIPTDVIKDNSGCSRPILSMTYGDRKQKGEVAADGTH